MCQGEEVPVSHWVGWLRKAELENIFLCAGEVKTLPVNSPFLLPALRGKPLPPEKEPVPPPDPAQHLQCSPPPSSPRGGASPVPSSRSSSLILPGNVGALQGTESCRVTRTALLPPCPVILSSQHLRKHQQHQHKISFILMARKKGRRPSPCP